MSNYSYVGQVPASKSLLNRALIVQSYFNELKIKGSSTAEDVLAMKLGLQSFFNRLPIDCGSGGAVLRFMALRIAREEGEFTLKGTPRLMSRLNKQLTKVLGQLSCEVQWKEDQLFLKTHGWKLQGDALHIPSGRSSQFASAVLLNAWNLEKPLFLVLDHDPVSKGYLDMTLWLVRSLGMDVKGYGREYLIESKQKLDIDEVLIEPDVSCAFALAAIAAVSGSCTLKPFPSQSLQPDIYFIELLKKMNVDVDQSENQLTVKKNPPLKALTADLNSCPDLFPILSSLCALAQGESLLKGAPQLKYKESSRVKKMVELLKALGVECQAFEDGMGVRGPEKWKNTKAVEFDPDQDHRLAMAAAVLKKAGAPLVIKNPEVVNKSFPGFWERAQLQ